MRGRRVTSRSAPGRRHTWTAWLPYRRATRRQSVGRIMRKEGGAPLIVDVVIKNFEFGARATRPGRDTIVPMARPTMTTFDGNDASRPCLFVRLSAPRWPVLLAASVPPTSAHHRLCRRHRRTDWKAAAQGTALLPVYRLAGSFLLRCKGLSSSGRMCFQMSQLITTSVQKKHRSDSGRAPSREALPEPAADAGVATTVRSYGTE
jgi:hypothetical protein